MADMNIQLQSVLEQTINQSGIQQKLETFTNSIDTSKLEAMGQEAFKSLNGINIGSLGDLSGATAMVQKSIDGMFQGIGTNLLTASGGISPTTTVQKLESQIRSAVTSVAANPDIIAANVASLQKELNAVATQMTGQVVDSLGTVSNGSLQGAMDEFKKSLGSLTPDQLKIPSISTADLSALQTQMGSLVSDLAKNVDLPKLTTDLQTQLGSMVGESSAALNKLDVSKIFSGADMSKTLAGFDPAKLVSSFDTSKLTQGLSGALSGLDVNKLSAGLTSGLASIDTSKLTAELSGALGSLDTSKLTSQITGALGNIDTSALTSQLSGALGSIDTSKLVSGITSGLNGIDLNGIAGTLTTQMASLDPSKLIANFDVSKLTSGLNANQILGQLDLGKTLGNFDLGGKLSALNIGGGSPLDLSKLTGGLNIGSFPQLNSSLLTGLTGSLQGMVTGMQGGILSEMTSKLGSLDASSLLKSVDLQSLTGKFESQLSMVSSLQTQAMGELDKAAGVLMGQADGVVKEMVQSFSTINLGDVSSQLTSALNSAMVDLPKEISSTLSGLGTGTGNLTGATLNADTSVLLNNSLASVSTLVAKLPSVGNYRVGGSLM